MNMSFCELKGILMLLEQAGFGQLSNAPEIAVSQDPYTSIMSWNIQIIVHIDYRL